MYYRREVQPPPPITYGYRKISSRQEENEITHRLLKSTYERKLYSEEATQVSNYQYLIETGNRRRPPSACTHTPTPSRKSDSKRLSERDMIRLLRRLMKPTESLYNAQLMTNKEEEQELKEERICRTKTPSEAEDKVIRRVQRPTTASRAKKINDCHLCYEHENKSEKAPPDAFDYEYGIEVKKRKQEEVDEHLRRMRTPTYSSVDKRQCGDNRKCPKTPSMIDEVKIRAQLPLVSGLSRTKNVKDIVNRLYPKPKYRIVPAATPFTSYTAELLEYDH